MARAVFVPPEGCATARRLLTAGRVVVLCGPPRSGRRAAALHLLSGQGLAPIIAIEADTPSEVTGQILAPDHGYLVHGPAASRIAAGHLGTLTDHLAAANARMVVLVDDPAPLPDAVRRVHAARLGIPDPVRVLHRHLAWALGTDPSPGLPLRTLIPPGTQPGKAAAIAAALAAHAHREPPTHHPEPGAPPDPSPPTRSTDPAAPGVSVYEGPGPPGHADAGKPAAAASEPAESPGSGRTASPAGSGGRERPGPSGHAEDGKPAVAPEPVGSPGSAGAGERAVPGAAGRVGAGEVAAGGRPVARGTGAGRVGGCAGSGGPWIDAAVVEASRADSDGGLDRWFDAHGDPDEVAFLIACAAFEGFDFEDVALAADRLRPALRAPDAPPADPLRRGRRHLLGVVGARLVPDVVAGPTGRQRIERVVFPPGRSTAVLSFVWREYRALRPAVLDWLLDGCDGAAAAVHARTGAVVGILVGAATGPDVTAAFDAWAADDRPWVRTLAARALDAAGRDEIVGTQVRARLASWDSGDDPNRAEVAVRVYGGLFGRVRPAVAFDRLQRAAAGPDLARAVADSLVRLIEDDELRPSVLAMLARWYEDPDLAPAATTTITRALGAAPPAAATPAATHPGGPPISHSSGVHKVGTSLDPGAVDEPDAGAGWIMRAALARDRLAYWRRGGNQARSLLVQALEGTRSHVTTMRALWDVCLLAPADAVLAGRITAVLTDLLRPPATEGLRWLADDLADRIGDEPADDFRRGLLRHIRGFRALDREGPALFTAEPLPAQRLAGIRVGWDRAQALVLLGRDGRLTADHPGRRGVRVRDVLTRRYAAAYRVELGGFTLRFPVDLPDRSVDVRLTWRVSDPAQVVKRRMRDGAAYVHQVVESRVRRLAADHEADLQAALDAELARPVELPEAGLTFSDGRAWVPDRPRPHRP